MARFEIESSEYAAMGHGVATGDMFFRLGMMHSTGRTADADLISAHKWFNLAAAKGHENAARYRQEIAREMNAEQIAEAQRAAREWLRMH